MFDKTKRKLPHTRNFISNFPPRKANRENKQNRETATAIVPQVPLTRISLRNDHLDLLSNVSEKSSDSPDRSSSLQIETNKFN